MINRYLAVCFGLLWIINLPAGGQALTGMSGLLNAPSGDFQSDGTFFLGFSYLDKNTIDYGEKVYNSLAYYGNITILPFVEIGLRSTGRLNEPIPFHVDRMPSMRIRLLGEKKYLPSLVAGAHDFLTSAKIGNQHFGAFYLAASKNVGLSGFRLGFHAGYGFKVFRHNQFTGPFGGISLSHEKFKFLTLAGEYDSRTLNLGVKLLIFNHLQLLAVLQGMKYFSGGVTYRIMLPSGK